MGMQALWRSCAHVALLAEGVDRNPALLVILKQHIWSPSSRRAWIEIFRKLMLDLGINRRPPRGGRG